LNFIPVILTDFMPSAAISPGWAFNSWFWLSAILGYGAVYLNFSNRLLTYARTAVLPFYILHQTIIVTIGFFISQWEISVMIKYLMLSSLSFVLVIAIYHLVIRRIGLFAFLFGMKSEILEKPGIA